MFIGLYDDYFIKGPSLEAVWKNLQDFYDAEFENTVFYEIPDNPLDVEIVILRKKSVTTNETVVHKGKLPK